MSSSQTGLFLVHYTIGTGALGAPSLSLSLTVNTTNRTISGYGDITQAVNPPVGVETNVNGTYVPIVIMGAPSLLVEATGYPVVIWPIHGGIGPVLLPNFYLRMVFDGSWESGTAYYRYQNAEGQWVEVSDVPAKKTDLPLPKAS